MDLRVRATHARRASARQQLLARHRGRASAGRVVWEELSTMLHRERRAGRRGGRRAGARSAVGRSHASTGVSRRPRPPLRGRLGRSQPDPHASRLTARLARLPARDRARHVDQGTLPGRARGPSAATRSRPRCASARRSCCPRPSRSAMRLRTTASASRSATRTADDGHLDGEVHAGANHAPRTARREQREHRRTWHGPRPAGDQPARGLHAA